MKIKVVGSIYLNNFCSYRYTGPRATLFALMERSALLTATISNRTNFYNSSHFKSIEYLPFLLIILCLCLIRSKKKFYYEIILIFNIFLLFALVKNS